MSTEMTLEAAAHPKIAVQPMIARLGRLTGLVSLYIVVTALLLAGWYVWKHAPYASDSNLAYNLGLGGGLLMLSLLLYPLRKRVRATHYLGPIRHWFRFHMVAGVLGPLLVLFHSTFRVHSTNAAIALGSMLLVVASGMVGRLLYRRIHRGLYGRRVTLGELQESLQEQLEMMHRSHDLPDEIKAQIAGFARLVSIAPEGRWHRTLLFLTLGFRRRSAARRARVALTRHARTRTSSHRTLEDLSGLLVNIGATLRAAQTAAQFATYERLFSYWHAVHIPFLFMLFVTAVVHVIAVHAY